MDDDGYNAALARERNMYLAQGRKDRAAEVDAELKRLGVAPVKEATVAPPERAVRRGRKAE